MFKEGMLIGFHIFFPDCDCYIVSSTKCLVGCKLELLRKSSWCLEGNWLSCINRKVGFRVLC